MAELLRNGIRRADWQNRNSEFAVPGENAFNSTLGSAEYAFPDLFLTQRKFNLQFTVADHELIRSGEFDAQGVVREATDHIIRSREAHQQVARRPISPIEITRDHHQSIVPTNAGYRSQYFVQSFRARTHWRIAMQRLILPRYQVQDAQNVSTTSVDPHRAGLVIVEDKSADTVALLKYTPGGES